MAYAGIDVDSGSGQKLWSEFSALTTEPQWNTSSTRLNRVWAPFILVGLERYDRIAARYGVELRSPFVDRGLVEFCLSLPNDQLQRHGWTKWILRQVLIDEVPGSVVWRPKVHDALDPFGATVSQRLASLGVDDRLPPVFAPATARTLEAQTQAADGAGARRAVNHWLSIHS